MASSLIAASIPIFFVLIGLELLVARARRRSVYRFQDAINSLSCGVGQQAFGIVLKFATVGAYFAIYEAFAILELDPSAWWVWVLGALGVDLAYYAAHRASHRVGFLWAGHVVHHQSQEYNLSTALRQSALQGTMSAAFYWPLAILGLPPALFLLLSTLNTLYQFWIHTRLIGRMGPLEWVLNTPSHHRVHHGIDPKYIDKNYAGVLIIWDRLFGTFQAEEEEPVYGTVKPLDSWNPIWANLEHWARMARMARRTRSWRDKVACFFAPPEWRPPDLGGPVTIPEVDREARELYARPDRAGLALYVATQFAIVGAALVQLLTSFAAAPGEVSLTLAAWILASILSWGGLFEARRWAAPLEVVRWIAAPFVAWPVVSAGDLPGWLGPLVVGVAAASLTAFALVWRRPVRELQVATSSRG